METARFARVIGAFAGLLFSVSIAAESGNAAKTLYTLDISPIYANASGHGAVIGTVTPGTPLLISGKEDREFQAFTLDAWVQEGNDATLFAAQGQRIVLATLADKSAPLNTRSTATDAYGNVWHAVELSGFIKKNELTADQNAVWAKAIALYNTRCSACHALHHPNEFTVNQWPKILKTMTHNAALQPGDAALVTQYIQTHAKR